VGPDGQSIITTTTHFSQFSVYAPLLTPPSRLKESKLPPVLLVHGFQPTQTEVVAPAWGEDDSTWGALSPFANGGGLLDRQDQPINTYQLDYYTHKRIKKAACDLSASIDQVIQQEQNYSGQPQVQLIVHSMGGLVARAYIQGKGGEACPYKGDVYSLATLGSPHGGAPGLLYNDSISGLIFSEIQGSTSDMRPGSSFLRDLNRSCLPDLGKSGKDYLVLQGSDDKIVPPPHGSILDNLSGYCNTDTVDEKDPMADVGHFMGENAIAAISSKKHPSFEAICDWVGACKEEKKKAKEEDLFTFNLDTCYQDPHRDDSDYLFCSFDLKTMEILQKKAKPQTIGRNAHPNPFFVFDFDPEIGFSRHLEIKSTTGTIDRRHNQVKYDRDNAEGLKIEVSEKSGAGKWSIEIVERDIPKREFVMRILETGG